MPIAAQPSRSSQSVKSKNVDDAPSKRRQPTLLLQRAQIAPETLTSTDVLSLQRTIGNRATVGLLSRSSGLQAKLKLGPAGDKHEQEADRVADQVVRHMDHSQPTDTDVQRHVDEEEMAQMKPLHGAEGGEVESSVAQQIQSARGGGQPLNKGIRAKMEQGFGADFSRVSVHTGGQADTLNRSLNARAFTVGNDVFFGKGQYNPGSSGGQKLLAHELTHTVQQGAAGVQRLTVQRDYTPEGEEDPLTHYGTGDKSLFYGIGPSRTETMKRMNTGQSSNKYRTIDEVNQGVGIGRNMEGKMANGIFMVRQALEDPANWKTHLPEADTNWQQDQTLQAWIQLLVKNKRTIGLYDFADPRKKTFAKLRKKAGIMKINSRNRLTKNSVGSQDKVRSGEVTAEQISTWLSMDINTGLNITLNDLPEGIVAKDLFFLKGWIYNAFFRRTSKLGLEFATKVLKTNVYFNLSADPNFDPQNPTMDGTQQGGIRVTSKDKDRQKLERPITVSEYRHAKKMMKWNKGMKKKINFYDEFK